MKITLHLHVCTQFSVVLRYTKDTCPSNQNDNCMSSRVVCTVDICYIGVVLLLRESKLCMCSSSEHDLFSHLTLAV